MKTPEGVPAIVFHVRTSEVKGSEEGKYYGYVELDGVFTDYEMWDDVLEQLEGFALSRGDLKEEIIDVLREKNRELEGSIEYATHTAHSETQKTLQALSLVQSDNARLQQRVHILEAQLEELKALEDFTLDEG